MIEFKMPSLGADMEDGVLAEWRKKPGDAVQRGDIIADVETQKGLIEIEVFDEGVIEKLLIEEGAKVPVGTVMALINPDGKTVAAPAKQATRVRATPLARRIAEENKIALSSITGSGEDGAITREDVERAIKLQGKKAEEPVLGEKETRGEETRGEKTRGEETRRVETPEEENPVEKTRGMETHGEETRGEEISEKTEKPADLGHSIRMAVDAAMSKSNREIPHYYLETKVDMRKAVAWLKETNAQRPPKQRLLPAALYIKAVAKALEAYPELNAVWEDGPQLKNEINIGFVVSLRTGGLIVPAIQGADAKTVDEIMEALNDIIPRARALKLRSSELSASTFTITSLGEGGADRVYGVIYPPQVGIVGFGDITEQPFAENGMLDVRPVLYATLAGDHRATDGLTGSRFLSALKNHLQNPETL